MKNDSTKPVRHVPEAAWLARPEPKRIPWLRRFVDGVTSVPVPVWSTIGISLAAYLILGYLGFQLFTLIAFCALVLSCSGAAVIGAQKSAERAAQTSPNLRNMIESTGLSGGHEVSLAIYTGGKGTGFDEGVVIFQGGMLRFYGLATSFRLSTGLVYAPGNRFKNGPFEFDKKAGIPLGDHAKGTAIGFVLRDPTNAEIILISTEGGDRERLFERTLYKWLLSPPEGDDNSILPPLETQPELAKGKRKKEKQL